MYHEFNKLCKTHLSNEEYALALLPGDAKIFQNVVNEGEYMLCTAHCGLVKLFCTLKSGMDGINKTLRSGWGRDNPAR